MKRAITGLGIVSSVGIGSDAFYEAMRAPTRVTERPRLPILSFDAAAYESPRITEVPSFDATKFLGDKGLRTLDRMTKLFVVAARLCLHDAGFKKENQWVSSGPERVGLCCSNAYGSLEAISELDRVAQLEDARYINPAKFPNTVSNSAAGYVSIWEDLRALNVSVSDGNCGALDAVSCADLFLASERAEALLVGGGEAMSEPLFLAFEKLGAFGDIWLGEGAAFFSVEPPSKAKERGARVLATIDGYGTSFIAPPDGMLRASREAMKRAIASALSVAGIDGVDIVSSSASGIARFDDEELAAIEEAIGRTPIAAPKLVLGETLGAGGAMGMAAALAWIRGVPPSPMIRGDAPSAVRSVLVTSQGYYGNASAVVMRA